MQATLSLAILLGVLVVVIIAEERASPMSEEKKKLLADCKAQEKATDDDVNQFVNFKIPAGPNGNCFMACIFEKSGGIIRDGKINAGALKAEIIMEHGGNEKAAPVNEIVSDCEALHNSQRCELAFQLMDCVAKSYAKHPPK